MPVKQVVLTLEPALFRKIERKAGQMGYSNVQKYIYELIRRSMKGRGGRPKIDVSSIDPYVSKFATPTKKTYQILRELKGAS